MGRRTVLTASRRTHRRREAVGEAFEEGLGAEVPPGGDHRQRDQREHQRERRDADRLSLGGHSGKREGLDAQSPDEEPAQNLLGAVDSDRDPAGSYCEHEHDRRRMDGNALEPRPVERRDDRAGAIERGAKTRVTARAVHPQPREVLAAGQERHLGEGGQAEADGKRGEPRERYARVPAPQKVTEERGRARQE